MLEEYENNRPRRGQIIQGEVLAKDEDMLILDVGAKRDAIVPPREVVNLDEELIEDISLGDHVPVYVTRTSSYDNELLVSIEKGLEQRDWERAKKYLASAETIEAEVVSYNKGGLQVAFGRLKGFVPNSKVPGMPRGLSMNEKLKIKAQMIGRSMLVNVIEVNQHRKRLILSGLAAEEKLRKQRLKELPVGEKVSGTVSHVVDFGVFVDLDGVDGLIHRSRLSWDKVENPSDMLQSGDEVEVLIKDVDIERERVSLDRKACLPSPWDEFSREHSPGEILEGEVVSVRDFGAFVRLTDHITGLLHVSELLPGVSREPTTVLAPGDVVPVRIIAIDAKQERVSLSMRRLPEDDIAHWVMEA